MTFQARVIAGGKIVIPAELRRALGIKDGDTLTIEQAETGSFRVSTRGQVVSEVRAAFRAMREPGRQYAGVIDELIAERRAAAAQEDRDG